MVEQDYDDEILEEDDLVERDAVVVDVGVAGSRRLPATLHAATQDLTRYTLCSLGFPLLH